jgi:hypothetical protein
VTRLIREPLLHLGACAHLARDEPSVAVALGEIRDDRDRLEHAKAVVVEHGDATERVDRTKRLAEVLPLEEIDMAELVGEPELFGGPERLADVAINANPAAKTFFPTCQQL